MHFCVELCKYFINEWRHTFYLTKNGQEFTKYIRSFMTAIMLYLERWKRMVMDVTALWHWACIPSPLKDQEILTHLNIIKPWRILVTVVQNQWSLAYHGIVLHQGESACSGSSLHVQLNWYLITFLLYIGHY